MSWTATLATAGTQASLAGDPDRLEAMGDAELAAAARAIAYRLDPDSFVARRRRAEDDRRVTLRPAPDTMAALSALLPVKDGVTVYATLTRHADTLRAGGDQRSQGQIMADTLTERIAGNRDTRCSGPATTGPATTGPSTGTEATTGTGTATGTASGTASGTAAGVAGVVLDVLISDHALLAGGDPPAHVLGYGPVPADLVRQWATDPAATTWLRKLYATPETGALVAMDSRARLFPDGLARMIRLRDQTCRTPWCDAPIRHTDHAHPPRTTGPPATPTGKGCARPATTPNKHPAGGPAPAPPTASTPPHPPGTDTAPTHHPNPHPHHRPAPPRGTTSTSWSPEPRSSASARSDSVTASTTVPAADGTAPTTVSLLRRSAPRRDPWSRCRSATPRCPGAAGRPAVRWTPAPPRPAAARRDRWH
ncbi:hypothetical protein BH20ACT5_BH20ACT5_09980 [soil metagenome]